MNCHEVKEHISFAVDNRLEGTMRADFDTHIASCPGCRNEYELERLTKRFVKKMLHRSSAPSELSGRIVSHLESYSGEEAAPSLLQWLLAVPRLKPAFILGVIAVIALLLFVSLPLNIRHLHTSPDDDDVIHQSLNNYDAILAGTLQPQMASGDYGEVKTFFQNRIGYPVRVPKIDRCKQMGALVSQYKGKNLAHLVYKFDDQVVYLYQVDMGTVLEGTALTIPANAREELLKTGWYVETPHPNCSIVMWVVDNTLCTAVADMDKSQLIAYLSYSGE